MGEYLSIIKKTYRRPTESIMLNGEKLKAFPYTSETRLECLPTLSGPIQCGAWCHTWSNKASEGDERNTNGKSFQGILFTGYVILYRNVPKGSTKISYFQQGSRAQNQHIKISSLPIYKWQKYQVINQKNNPFHSSLKNILE